MTLSRRVPSHSGHLIPKELMKGSIERVKRVSADAAKHSAKAGFETVRQELQQGRERDYMNTLWHLMPRVAIWTSNAFSAPPPFPMKVFIGQKPVVLVVVVGMSSIFVMCGHCGDSSCTTDSYLKE